jgi:hypothetical protein
VKAYGEIIEAYRVHEETKSVGPDREPCTKRTRGLLGRRDVSVLGTAKHVGKESNKLEERMREELDGGQAILNVYEERICACGCGVRVVGRSNYVDRAHKQRGWRVRRQQVGGSRRI